MTDLRSELAKRGLPSDGLKAELVYRLQARLDEEEFGLPDDVLAPEVAVAPTETRVTPVQTKPEKTHAAAAVPPSTTTISSSISKMDEHDKKNAKPEPTALASKVTETKSIGTTDVKPVVVTAETAKISIVTAATTTSSIVKDDALEEKKKRRAERFGIPIASSSATTSEHPSKRPKIATPTATLGTTTTKSIFGDILLPKDEIERRLARASKFASAENEQITLELKAMLRKYKFGEVTKPAPVANKTDNTPSTTAAAASFATKLASFDTNIQKTIKIEERKAKKKEQQQKKDVAARSANKDKEEEEALLPKEEIERRLQRAEKFGNNNETTMKLKAMLRKHRFQEQQQKLMSS